MTDLATAFQSFGIALLSYVVVDRILARYLTGSWTGTPYDLKGDNE